MAMREKNITDLENLSLQSEMPYVIYYQSRQMMVVSEAKKKKITTF